MAGITFLLKDASAAGGGGGHGSLTRETAAAGTMGTGWTVATSTANSFSTMLYGTTRAANTFVTGVDPLSTAFGIASAQTWRSEFTLDGTFTSATNWTFSFAMIAVSTAASQTGRIKARLYKSADPIGATATQLTIATAAGLLTGTTAAFTKATTGQSTFSWTPTGIPSFTNEYLFIKPEWNTVVAGTRAGCDAIFVATANSNVVTSNFTAATVQVTAADSLSFTETLAGARTTRSTAAESFVLVDTSTRQRIASGNTTELFTLVDTDTAQRFADGAATEALTMVDAANANVTTAPSSAVNYGFAQFIPAMGGL